MRKYTCSDNQLLADANKMLENLIGDLNEFTVYDKFLNTDKRASLELAVTEASAMPSDWSVQKNIKVYTGDVNDIMKESVRVVDRIRYFAERAFKGSPILDRFNFSRYMEAQSSQTDFPAYLRELHKLTQEQKATLTARGIEEELLDQPGQLADAIAAADTKQETKKDTRTTTTSERVEKFNKVYDIMLEFSLAAKKVYKDNPQKKAWYKLP